MTNAREIKKLAEPLLARHADLALTDGWTMIKPIRHLLRGIIIDRTSSASIFQPSWAITHLCEPLDTFPLNWGERLFRSKPGSWRWDDPAVPDEFYDIGEQETLPFVRGIETLDDYVAFTGPDRFPLDPLDAFPLRKIMVDVARGDLDSAREICARLQAGTMWSDPDFREELSRVLDVLCPLLAADDRVGLARQLREWEAFTAQNLKIESIWEPTPFPLELQSR